MGISSSDYSLRTIRQSSAVADFLISESCVKKHLLCFQKYYFHINKTIIILIIIILMFCWLCLPGPKVKNTDYSCWFCTDVNMTTLCFPHKQRRKQLPETDGFLFPLFVRSGASPTRVLFSFPPNRLVQGGPLKIHWFNWQKVDTISS